MLIHLEFHVYSTDPSIVINYTGKEYLMYLKKNKARGTVHNFYVQILTLTSESLILI